MEYCSCGAYSCITEKKVNAKVSALHEYGKVILSLLLLTSGVIVNALGLAFFREGSAALIWCIMVYLPVGIPMMKETWESIREKNYLSEFTLIATATLGTFYIDEYPEGAAVMLLYTVGELFQNKAVDRAKRNIGALLDVRSEKALVFRGGNLVIESPEKIKVGEIIEIEAGGRVLSDGTMQNEMAAFNIIALTGENVPRSTRKDEEVLAGMIVTDKVIRLEVTRPFDRSTLARILKLVQSASGRKAPAELFIRKFARICIPIVIVLAVLAILYPFVYSLINPPFIFAFNDWLYKTLVSLVVSCPYVLVVNVPLGYSGGIGAAPRLGTLSKGDNYLNAITKISTMVFGKTRTLIKGTFEVQARKSTGEILKEELVRLAVSVGSDSTRPIAEAVVNYAKEQNIECVVVTGTEEFTSYSLEAATDGAMVLTDNCQLLSKLDISCPKELLGITNTIMVCVVGDRHTGYLLLADVLKEDAKVAISDLKALNIENIQVLSDDKQSIVTNFAEKLGISKVYGGLLSEGKANHLEELWRDEANRIAFVGDGMNDTPVFTLSHVSITIGGLGSDAVTETADVVVQTDQSPKIAGAIKVGKLTRRTIWQNVPLAFGVKLLVLILGIGGIAILWGAVFADVGVALFATINAVRIQRMIKQEKDGGRCLFG